MLDRTRTPILVVAVLASLALGGCSLSPNSGRAPHAAIDASRLSGPAPLTVTFDASGSTDDGEIVDYEWTFDGEVSTTRGPHCDHTFCTPGIGEVTLTVTDTNGNVASARVDIVVANSPPVASFYLSDDAPDINEWMTVDGSGSYDPEGSEMEFAWTFGDGGTARGPRAGHAYTSEGSYTVTLTVRDAAGGEAVVRHDVLVHRATPGGGCSGGAPIVLF